MSTPTAERRVPHLRIGHGNGHNENSLVRFVQDADCDSFSGNETQRLLGRLRAIAGHRVTVAGDDYTEARNRARSTCVVTKSSLPNLGELTRKVSDRFEPALRVAPDRILVASYYEHPVAKRLGKEGVAHFALHPNAAPEALGGTDGNHPIVRRYRESLESTYEYMRVARREDMLVILTGDLQVGEHNDRPWSPRRRIAQPLKLKTRNVGIDWIMIDPLLEFAGDLHTRELHDHPGFWAALRPAR